MTNQETTDYIHHHLKIAGRTDPLFTDDAITLIHTTSRGKPRTTNRLAISALIATCATNKHLIDETSARSAITEHTDTQTTTTP